MLAELIRQPSTDEGTFGVLRIPQLGLAWASLELPERANAPQYSRIPEGIYACELRPTSKWSPRNGRELPEDDHQLYQVLDVPGRDLIKIHAATWAGDVRLGWHSDLLGCIAPGRRVGTLAPADTGRLQACVLESRGALTEFMRALRGESFELIVKEAS